VGGAGGHPGFDSLPALVGCAGDEPDRTLPFCLLPFVRAFFNQVFLKKKKKKIKTARGEQSTVSPRELVLLNTEKSKSGVQQRPRFPVFDTDDKLEHNEKILAQK